jgi:ABC-2 type transport system ATP-binding protein
MAEDGSKADRGGAGGAGEGRPPVVIARGLTKTFKDFWLRSRAKAVDGVDFDIHRGEIFGLLGPNGSGKSTTIKMVLGLLKKSTGRLAVFGKPPTDVSIKKRIGYLPEESYLYPFLNARETLDYYGKLFQLGPKARRRRIDELLEMVGLTGVQHRQVQEYSKGMQRRIGLAQALINDPEFLILDEPTTGLDPIGSRQVKDLIVGLGRRGKTILLSSHQLSDVEDVVDRTAILYGGRIRASGTCDELLAETSRSVIETDALDEQTIAEIAAVLERRRHAIERVRPARQRLEDLFIHLVDEAKRERLENAGAAHGGATAGFLRGDEEPRREEGGALIEQLTDPASEDRDASASPADASSARAEADEEDVIGDLVGERGSGSDGPGGAVEGEERDRDAASAGGEREAGGVDESVIGSLLGDGGERRPAGDEESSGGRREDRSP